MPDARPNLGRLHLCPLCDDRHPWCSYEVAADGSHRDMCGVAVREQVVTLTVVYECGACITVRSAGSSMTHLLAHLGSAAAFHAPPPNATGR